MGRIDKTTAEMNEWDSVLPSHACLPISSPNDFSLQGLGIYMYMLSAKNHARLCAQKRY